MNVGVIGICLAILTLVLKTLLSRVRGQVADLVIRFHDI